MKKALFILAFLNAFAATSQVRINEICPANDSLLWDESGQRPDWVELYNTSTSPLNLQGYYFLNNNTDKWYFPNILLPGNSRITVFFSLKNRKDHCDHVEEVLRYDSVWKYLQPSSEPDTNWIYPGFDDSTWGQDTGGFGQEDYDDATWLNPSISLYIRKTFSIADTSKASFGVLEIDYDDAFVAYLNGVEIGRFGVGIKGEREPFNTFAYISREAQRYLGGEWEYFYLNKQKLTSALVNGVNVLSIQVHNRDTSFSDMSIIPNFYLGVKNGNLGYPVMPFRGNGLHTSFGLNSGGETVTLFNAAGTLEDQVTYPRIHQEHSYGRSSDGAGSFCVFSIPTINASNTGTCFTGYAASPLFSLQPGFYAGTQSLALSSAEGSVHYTLDASEPSLFDPLYVSPLILDSTKVVRAKVFPFSPLILESSTLTKTFFINENISLPVISLVSTPFGLWDSLQGMYASGPNADSVFPFFYSNFHMEWARTGHTEFFNTNKQLGFKLDHQLRMHGGWSRGFPQKSFRIYAKDDFGSDEIDYPLFPHRNYSKIKNFNLRNAGLDWNSVHFRDLMVNRALLNSNLDVGDGQNVVVFLNGKYWGVYEVRERYDENYLSSIWDTDKDLDLVSQQGFIHSGDNDDWLKMLRYVEQNDLTQSAAYDSVRRLLDVENMMDYFAAETYIVNNDWIGNYNYIKNIKCWRPDGAGKWRYILWDTDLGVGLDSYFGYDLLSYAINPPDQNPHSDLFRKLLTNNRFKNDFINRYADLINYHFETNRFRDLAESIRDHIIPEMARHFAKWGDTTIADPYTLGEAYNISSWNAKYSSMIGFMIMRPQFARNFIQSNFQLQNQSDLILDVQPPGAGRIKISTIWPDEFPWQGTYFNGVPVKLEIQTFPGYEFVQWEGDFNFSRIYTDTFTLNFVTNDRIVARFKELYSSVSIYPNPASSAVTVSWMQERSGEAYVGVYDISGRLMVKLTSEGTEYPKGTTSVTLDPLKENLRAGIYFVKYRQGDFEESKKLVLVRD